MGNCNTCYSNSCKGNCNKTITRQVRIQNNSIGRDGLNSTRIIIYHRGETQPSVPNIPIEYNFNTGILIGLPSQWDQQEIEDNGLPLWISSVQLISGLVIDYIHPNQWSIPKILVVSGQDGDIYIPEETNNYFNM